MDEVQPRTAIDDGERARGWSWRRVLVVVGLVLAVLILVVVAIYAGAFIILAPMMQ